MKIREDIADVVWEQAPQIDDLWIKDEVVKLLTCEDDFLAFPKFQPKADIADYVESQWFLVSERFETIEEAEQSWEAYVIRSLK